MASAVKFQQLTDKFGPQKALEIVTTDPELLAMTTGDWLDHHVEQLTGVRVPMSPRESYRMALTYLVVDNKVSAFR